MSEGERAEACLRSALDTGRFELLYQPQFSSRDNRLVGVEGLVRLRDEHGVLVSPSNFIQAMERTSLIHDLGLFVFEQGCTDSLLWPSIAVAINVSPAQFRDPDLVDKLIAISNRVGTLPRQIEIEITEGMFFENPDRSEAALCRLHEVGFGIVLDDFGTGFSSLSYLLRFPVNKIKIDRSFIANVAEDVKSATIVHAIVALGRALGLKIVAEGVETEAQRQFLRTAGCHLLQGYLLARAVPAQDVSALLEAQAAPKPWGAA